MLVINIKHVKYTASDITPGTYINYNQWKLECDDYLEKGSLIYLIRLNKKYMCLE